MFYFPRVEYTPYSVYNELYEHHDFDEYDDEFYSEDEQDQITKYILSDLLNDPVEKQEFDTFLQQGYENDYPETTVEPIKRKISKIPCKFGYKCRFLKAGTCTFTHDELKPICKYGVTCSRKGTCKFSH